MAPNDFFNGLLGQLRARARRRARSTGQEPRSAVDFRPGCASEPSERTMTTQSSHPDNAQAQIELHKTLAPRYAYRYGFPFSRLFQQDWHAEMISHVPPDATKVLDIGCGTGFFLAELEQQHPGAIGLDISHEMLKVSDQYVPGARLVTGDAEHLPFVHGTFDTVFCKGSLHHMRDHVGFLTSCREMLPPGGRLVMSEPCNDNPFIRVARAILYKQSAHFDEGDQGFTQKGILELCQRAGFRVTKVYKYGVFAYVFAGFPDHIGLLRFIPGSAWITRAMIVADRWICRTPLLRLLGFHVIVIAEPEPEG